MKVFRKVDGAMQVFEYSGRDMNLARKEVAACTEGGAILIDVGTIPPAPPIQPHHFAPQFGTKVRPQFA